MVGERMREVMKSADKESSESEEDRGCVTVRQSRNKREKERCGLL